jgi:hypothetical protein
MGQESGWALVQKECRRGLLCEGRCEITFTALPEEVKSSKTTIHLVEEAGSEALFFPTEIREKT